MTPEKQLTMCSEQPYNSPNKLSHQSPAGVILITAVIAALTLLLGLVANGIFTAEQMYLVWPLLATCAVFAIFFFVLRFRVQENVFGEIAFIYLALAVAYTILPVVSLLKLQDILPPGTVFLPQTEAFGTHCWRHVLYISGVAIGYLAVRGKGMPQKTLTGSPIHRYGLIVFALMVIIGLCIVIVTVLSSPVTGYLEHYARFDHLSWPLLKLAQISLIFKGGGYFVLMALMFIQYRKYRLLIFIVVPIICAYEIVYSFGSRIETLTILLAFVSLYHYKVASISLKKGVSYLLILAVLFSVLELVRTAQSNEKSIQSIVATEGVKSASEFTAVFNTSFHLYSEREKGSLPPRDWQMFFYEFIALIPFVDHITYHPVFWYARYYFPDAAVPPQTMGVLADSAIWGGEVDLLLRSLVNGAIFAALTRWFLRRREQWWALTIYVYCYATCILTLKYSVLYQLSPFVKAMLPTLLLTGVLFRIKKILARVRSVP